MLCNPTYMKVQDKQIHTVRKQICQGLRWGEREEGKRGRKDYKAGDDKNIPTYVYKTRLRKLRKESSCKIKTSLGYLARPKLRRKKQTQQNF